MPLDLTYFLRRINTLERAYGLLQGVEADSIEYDMYRSACIKEFEIILEQGGKLLRKVLKPYFHSDKVADKLYFKDVFRQAVLRDLISEDACERWLIYRDSRNNTAHDYGVNFAEEILTILPQFITDAKDLATLIQNSNAH
jgi:nucleotidyltransferase substrate binding protein (TIGR01987 family)